VLSCCVASCVLRRLSFLFRRWHVLVSEKPSILSHFVPLC
jgi:hypothetical protein